MLNANMLIVIMLSVIMLNVVNLSVVAAMKQRPLKNNCHYVQRKIYDEVQQALIQIFYSRNL
jgi:hypothetical protein